MTNYHSKKVLSFLKLFEKFIRDSRSARRVRPNGERLLKVSIDNYKHTLVILKRFCIYRGFYLRIRPVNKLNINEILQEKNYWNQFYNQFTDFMYNVLGFFDNYAGQNMKNIRSFFSYLNKDMALGVGEFHKSFYVRREEINIFPLTPEQLNFLIYNKEFENSLSKRMQQVKDFFVFGCTVALRISDLMALKMSNMKTINRSHYLVVRAKKTNRETIIKLPEYSVQIVAKYARFQKRLLPPFNKSNLNIFIKRLLEKAGYTEPVLVSRNRRGKAIELKNSLPGPKCKRFCDVCSTHTMRRTAITTMLSLGMPEQVVRKISGHTPGSKEFYRYVVWAQTYQDKEVDKMFEKLKERNP